MKSIIKYYLIVRFKTKSLSSDKATNLNSADPNCALKGYDIPTDEEWKILTDFLGGEKLAGAKMKSTTSWQNNGNGNNTSGFAGLTDGRRYASDNN